MAANPQHEPTMEEILASIRKIISEDSSEAPPAAAAPVAPEAEAKPQPEADVLELTHEVHDEPAPAVVAAPTVIAVPPPMPEPTPEPVPAPVEVAPVEVAAAPVAEPEPETPEPVKPDNDVVFQSIEEVTTVSEPQAATPPAPHEGIFSDTTRKALEDSFAGIQAPQAPQAAPAAAVQLPPADTSGVQAAFEKAVRESFEPVFHQWLGSNTDAMIEGFKPLIREWMDAHFPALLEGAVRAEVERVARARH